MFRKQYSEFLDLRIEFWIQTVDSDIRIVADPDIRMSILIEYQQHYYKYKLGTQANYSLGAVFTLS